MSRIKPFITIALLAIALPAFAQEPKPTPPVFYDGCNTMTCSDSGSCTSTLAYCGASNDWKKAAYVPFEGSILPPMSIANDSPVPAPTPAQDGYSFSAMIGGTVSMSPGTDTQIAPIARLQVDGPLAIGGADTARLPRLHVTADLEALPGETIDQAGGLSGTLAQFKSLRFTVGASQRISKWVSAGSQQIATSIYVDGGFATRLDNEHIARDKAPRYVSVGVRFDEKTSGSFLKCGMGPDQRLDGTYQIAAHIEGYAKAYEMKSAGGAEFGVFVRAILGVNLASPDRPGLTGGSADSINVGFLAGWN